MDDSDIMADPKRGGRAQKSLILAIVFLGLYVSTWGGHYTSGDGSQKIAWAKAMLAGHFNAEENAKVEILSKYGIGHSILAMPPLFVASFVQTQIGWKCEAALYTLMFVVNGAMLLGMMAYYLLGFYEATRVYAVVAMIGLGSIWWPYTKLDFSEPLVTTILFGGFLLIRSGVTFWGMLLGASIITIRTDGAMLVALLFLWAIVRNRSIRDAVLLLGAVVPAIAVVAASNYIRYSSVFDRGYSGESFTTPALLGLVGILGSGGKSIFLFSPPLVLGILGFKRYIGRAEIHLDGILFLGIFLSQLALYSVWWDWSSDDAWGVRFMIPGVMFMCLPAVEALGNRLLLAIIFSLGFVVQFLAVSVGGLDYLMLLREQEARREALFVGGHNRIDFEDVRFNPRYSQIAGNWILMRNLLGVPPRASSPEFIKRNGTPLYDALPPHVWARARWDFIWLRVFELSGR
jgi:hypothetical protein